jgi:hypothetical protein
MRGITIVSKVFFVNNLIIALMPMTVNRVMDGCVWGWCVAAKGKKLLGGEKKCLLVGDGSMGDRRWVGGQ